MNKNVVVTTEKEIKKINRVLKELLYPNRCMYSVDVKQVLESKNIDFKMAVKVKPENVMCFALWENKKLKDYLWVWLPESEE